MLRCLLDVYVVLFVCINFYFNFYFNFNFCLILLFLLTVFEMAVDFKLRCTELETARAGAT